MLPRSQRVSKTLFETTTRASKVFHSPFFTLRVGTNQKTEKTSRFSSVVSKKINKKAVGRNALRRAMYEALGNQISEIKNGFIVLLFAKKGAEALDKETLQKEIAALLERAGLRTSQ